MKINEYNRIKAELITELTPVIKAELEPEIRKQVIAGLELEYFFVRRGVIDAPNVDNFINTVINETCNVFNVSCVDVLMSKSRKAPLPDVRAAIIYICRTLKEVPYTKVARVLNKHHATMIHGRRQCNNLMTTDKTHKAIIEQIIKNVNEIES